MKKVSIGDFVETIHGVNDKADGKNNYNWHNGIDVYHWWMQDGVLPGQMTIDRENDW